jgi:hypothetical protein
MFCTSFEPVIQFVCLEVKAKKAFSMRKNVVFVFIGVLLLLMKRIRGKRRTCIQKYEDLAM